MKVNRFKWQQGSVYLGNETINLLLAFSICVKDVRMLKIEENNDLMPTVLKLYYKIYGCKRKNKSG